MAALLIIIFCIGGLRIAYEDMECRQEEKRKREHWQRTGHRLRSK